LPVEAVVVIPCRLSSSRFSGKPLALLANKPLIQHVYEAAAASKEAGRIVVATDEPRIEEAVRSFGGETLRTSRECRSGTDRMAEVSRHIEAEVYVNLQADEVVLESELVDELIVVFRDDPSSRIGTFKKAILDDHELSDPNVVKVVTDQDGSALYFSRFAIPYVRDGIRGVPRLGDEGLPAAHYKHLGIYIYDRETLESYATWPTGIYERLEKLEQLRALEMGVKIRVWETSRQSLRIDTEQDLKEAEKVLRGRSHRE
jgi:3-deoxy-manno-octulosonate cytidylyltransferase (CMP-KDO synthetase)